MSVSSSATVPSNPYSVDVILRLCVDRQARRATYAALSSCVALSCLSMGAVLWNDASLENIGTTLKFLPFISFLGSGTLLAGIYYVVEQVRKRSQLQDVEKMLLSQIKKPLRSFHQLFPLQSLEDTTIAAKFLAHWLDFEGTVAIEKEKAADLAGMTSVEHPLLYRSLANSLSAFSLCKDFPQFALKQQKVELLQEAFSFAASRHHEKLYLDLLQRLQLKTEKAWSERIRNKELCFINAGWSYQKEKGDDTDGGHAICLAFFGNYMAIGNRGGGDSKTLKVFKIDPALMTPQIIYEILKSKHHTEAITYFYQTLPALLSPDGKISQDALCERFKSIQPDYQLVGNCSLTGIQAVIPFAWAILSDPNPSLETLQRAELESQLFQDWTAVSYAESIRPKDHFNDPQFLASTAKAKEQKKWDFAVTSLFLHHAVIKRLPHFSHKIFKVWKEITWLTTVFKNRDVLKDFSFWIRNLSTILEISFIAGTILLVISGNLLGYILLSAALIAKIALYCFERFYVPVAWKRYSPPPIKNPTLSFAY